MTPNTVTWGHLIKTEWLVADVTPVGFPDRVERDILEMILDNFWPIQAAFVVGEPLCEIEILSWTLKTLLRAIL